MDFPTFATVNVNVPPWNDHCALEICCASPSISGTFCFSDCTATVWNTAGTAANGVGGDEAGEMGAEAGDGRVAGAAGGRTPGGPAAGVSTPGRRRANNPATPTPPPATTARS